MMGFAMYDTHVPCIKTSSACLCLEKDDVADAEQTACINCGRCVGVCPGHVIPARLATFAEHGDMKSFQKFDGMECCECGCCSYVCPSKIPLVEYYRFAKSEILAQDKAKEAANLARERNDFRLARIEREKQERAAKHAQKAAGAKAETADDDAKKAAIAAAIERAKAQKADIAPQNTDNLPPGVQAEIAATDARRAEAASATETDKQES